MKVVKAQDAHLYLKPKKRSKFNNKRWSAWTGTEMREFASKAEAERYKELKLLETAGHIRNLKIQPVYELYAGIKYVGDFEYERAPTPLTKPFWWLEEWTQVTEDVKGVLTPVFKIKAKLFAEKYGRKIEIVRK